jgi:hypothetical protein
MASNYLGCRGEELKEGYGENPMKIIAQEDLTGAL